MQSNNYFRSESEREQHNYLDCDGSGWKFNGWGWGGCSVCCTRKQIVWNFRINVRLSQLSCPSDFVAVNRICRGRLKGRSSCQANNTWFVPPFASGWKERGCLRYNTVDCENTRAWCFWWMIRWLHLNKYSKSRSFMAHKTMMLRSRNRKYRAHKTNRLCHNGRNNDYINTVIMLQCRFPRIHTGIMQ